MHEVWITGAGIISALGQGLSVHATAITDARTGLAAHMLFNGEPPDPCICGIVPPDSMETTIDESAPNRANMLLEQAVAEALASADLSTPVRADSIAGTTLGNMHGGTRYYQKIRQDGIPELSLVKYFLPCAPVSHIVKHFGITGKHWTVASACGSASAAIGHAFHRIRYGQSDCIIAGGFEALSPFVVAGFNSLQLVSKKESRPFDCDRDGLNPGEGAAILILESREAAQARHARPLGKITGFGDALDAYHYTASHPEGLGLATAVSDALATAQLSANRIDHVHLHGTGTRVNDDSEYHALKKTFTSALGDIPVCSTKPMTGHTFGASGAFNVIFSLISLNKGIIPATLFHRKCDPAFEDLLLYQTPQKGRSIKNVLCTSLGFGGEAFALIATKADA